MRKGARELLLDNFHLLAHLLELLLQRLGTHRPKQGLRSFFALDIRRVRSANLSHQPFLLRLRSLPPLVRRALLPLGELASSAATQRRGGSTRAVARSPALLTCAHRGDVSLLWQPAVLRLALCVARARAPCRVAARGLAAGVHGHKAAVEAAVLHVERPVLLCLRRLRLVLGAVERGDYGVGRVVGQGSAVR